MGGARTFNLGSAACCGCGKAISAPFGVLGVVECASCSAEFARMRARPAGRRVSIFDRAPRLGFGRQVRVVQGARTVFDR